ncbi:MAG: TIGR03905 family TSCPD domain-containing protein [Clostridia bacterium]
MEYKTSGVCSRKISYELDGTKIKSVNFEGGCPGNLLGISQIVVGMEVKDVIDRFAGVKCGNKPTSCPDQLAKALAMSL